MNLNIRKIEKEDLPFLKIVLDSIELFPSDMLEDMVSDFFSNPQTTDFWFTAVQDKNPIAVGYCAPEKLTRV